MNTLRNMNLAGFIECAAAGIKPRDCKIDGFAAGFAAACYNDYSISELIEARKSRSADKTDCENWGLTPAQWRSEIKLALEHAMFLYVSDNDLK